MKNSLLLLDCLPTPELRSKYKIIYAGRGAVFERGLAAGIIDVDFATVAGQARMLDWLRQNDIPERVKCSLDSPDFEGAASEFLQAKVIGLTRVLEAALMLNPSIQWEFVTAVNGDIWSQSCEAYFRTLVAGLTAQLPQARITFL